ncbi:MAG TPA: TIGR04552 family protein [Pseudomonadota bacterium]|nr:TIGR04552 family protein [Pseudomonadota bacterium]
MRQSTEGLQDGMGRGEAESGAALTSVDRMAQATLADLEAMRLLLHGSSVIDWHQLAFSDLTQVHRFLRVNEFDPESAEDMDRLEELRSEAVEYLRRHFGYRIPDEIAEGVPVTDLLLLASRRERHQTYACIVLKVMLVLHHLDGRERLIRMPVSDVQLFGLVEAKVVQIVDELRGAGLPIVEFAWSRKERDSLITKLLAKRDSIAAHVYDKLRFRLITRHYEDLAPVLRELLSRLVPFNFVMPGQTVNRLLPFSRILRDFPLLRRHQDGLQAGEDINLGETADNSFSADTYRVINFVADLPLRVSQVMRHLNLPDVESEQFDPGGIIFVLTEFQVMDAATNLANEQGESSHEAYKERQHIEVKARLTRGMKARPQKSS